MKILVQKFGGTSVRDEESRKSAINHIKEAISDGYKVVVVVSAMGRKPDPYATDSILQLINYPKSAISKREYDLLLSCGETISSVVFSNELKQQNISAIALTGAQAGFVTSDDFSEAKIKAMKTERITSEMEQHDVIVVAGFQGQTESGEITTIGRGGSDTSATALGAALNADYVDIFTDVEGIMTADPRIVKSARTLDVVTYTEICNLAYQGAKVIHPRAVEIAMQANVPIRVRSTTSKEMGTLVTSLNKVMSETEITDRLITGIAHMDNLTQIKVPANDKPYELHSAVFKAMAEAGISVDFINISPTGVVFTIPELFTEKALHMLKELGFEPQFTSECAKVSLVGAGMSGVPGVTAKIVQTLTDKGISILQSADSHTTIWVLIHDRDLIPAVNELHEAFELNLNQSYLGAKNE